MDTRKNVNNQNNENNEHNGNDVWTPPPYTGQLVDDKIIESNESVTTTFIPACDRPNAKMIFNEKTGMTFWEYSVNQQEFDKQTQGKTAPKVIVVDLPKPQ